MIRSKLLMLALSFFISMFVYGCAEQKSDTTVSKTSNADVIKLAQIISKPSDHIDKKVVLNGNFFISCADACCNNEFILKDGINQIKVLITPELKIPELKPAQPVRVTGILKATAENPYIQATAVEVR